MKSKIFLLVGLFCFYFSFSKIVTKADEQVDSVLYNATFSVEYHEGIYYNPVMRQDYEIVDSNGTILQSGVTDDNGEIDFTYSTSNSLYINSLEIKLIIYASNYAGIVVDDEYNRNYMCDFILSPNINEEFNISVNDSAIKEEKDVYKGIKLSQYAVYSLLILEYEGISEIGPINIYIDKHISGKESISNYKSPNRIDMFVDDFKTFSHEYGHYVSDCFRLMKMNSANMHGGNSINLKTESKYDYIEIAICEGFARFYPYAAAKVILENYQHLKLYLNNILCDEDIFDKIEYPENKKLGDFGEKHIETLLWDLYDDNDNDEDISIELSEIFDILYSTRISKYNGSYTVEELGNKLVEENYLTYEELLNLYKINYISQDVIKSENGIKINLHYSSIRTSGNDMYTEIIIPLYNKHILNIYEKTYNGYTLLESFDFGFVSEDDLIFEGNNVYIEYEFTNEINNFIINNSFKELYYSIEQVAYDNAFETLYLSSYETPYAPICLVINEEGFRNINYIQGDNNYAIYGFNAPVEGIYKMYSTGTSNVMCFVYEDITDSSTLIASNDDRNGDDENFEVNVYLKTKEFVYIKVYFVVTGGSTRLNIELNETGSFLIDSPLFMLKGTEVTLNGGELNSTIITQGYSRIAYIPNGSWPTSRLDYNWYSSNDEVLTVSSYGTLQALSVDSETVVIVTAVNINNPNIFFMQYITVVPDTSNITKEVNINFSLINGSSEYITLNSLCPNPILQSYEWISSDESIAKVNELGYVTKVAEGETVIYGYYKYNSNYIIVVNVV